MTNYLDDFLFIAITRLLCNAMMCQLILLCAEINCPISTDKTEWAAEVIVFLGILLDGRRKILVVPQEKRIKALNMLQLMIQKRKATIKDIQCLTGLLNFISRAIIPGRAFTRFMYNKLRLTDKNNRLLKQHHHVALDKSFRQDCEVWIDFLSLADKTNLCHPFMDIDAFATSTQLDFYTDASKSDAKGFGCVYQDAFTWGVWGGFVKKYDPSIEFLELYVLCMGLLIWSDELRDMRVVIFCDNQAVVQMMNNTSSSCPNCLHLIRLIMLNGLTYNRRVVVKYMPTKENRRADALSRLQFDRFFKLSPNSKYQKPEKLSQLIWPPEKIWVSSDDNSK